MPSPAAAALVAGFVWIVDDYGIDPAAVRWWRLGVTLFAGLTMVSNLKFYSFKTINLRKSVPVRRDLPDRRCSSRSCSYQPALVLFAGFVAYASRATWCPPG